MEHTKKTTNLLLRYCMILSSAVILFYVVRSGNFTAIELGKFDVSAIISLLSSFFVVALLVERAIEVILSYLYALYSSQICLPAVEAIVRSSTTEAAVKRNLDMMQSPNERITLLSDTAIKTVTDAQRLATDEIAKANRKLIALKAPKTVTAVSMAILFGLAISMSGLQIFSSLVSAFQSQSTLDLSQSVVFRYMDIIMTALVIAGGADGIHTVINRLLGSSSLNIGSNPESYTHWLNSVQIK